MNIAPTPPASYYNLTLEAETLDPGRSTWTPARRWTLRFRIAAAQPETLSAYDRTVDVTYIASVDDYAPGHSGAVSIPETFSLSYYGSPAGLATLGPILGALPEPHDVDQLAALPWSTDSYDRKADPTAGQVWTEYRAALDYAQATAQARDYERAHPLPQPAPDPEPVETETV